MAVKRLRTTFPTTRRRGFGSGRGERAARRRRSEMPPCRSRNSMIWTTGCKNAVFVLLCVRVRASSRAICLKAQLSRLAQERRYATLTAARQALQELRVTVCNALAAFPLTPAPYVGKQVCRALRLTARKTPRRTPRVPTRRQRILGTCTDALPRFRVQPVRPRPLQT